MVKRELHPGAKWLFRVNAFFTLVFLLVFFGIWFGIMIATFLSAWGVSSPFVTFFMYIFLLIIVFIILIEVYARCSYRFWRYEFTNDQLRIERGIIWKRYSNVPYQRVQNVDITRGIIARLCGFSSVNL